VSIITGKEAMLLMQSLNKLGTPEQKLEALIKKHAELVSTIINNVQHLKHKKKNVSIPNKNNVFLTLYAGVLLLN